MRRFLKATAIIIIILILAVVGPILYVETACRGTSLAQKDPIYITAPQDHRPEARTYLTYPEWHIVYAYEGYAEAIRTSQPHKFPYLKAVTGFWSSLCALTKKADTLGEAGFDAKATIYTIGASFTYEMAAKALYEETLGRIASWTGTSTQDLIEANMAIDYATFLQQTPWYKYDFDLWIAKLNAAPTPNLRAYERRAALTLEWVTKAAYARVIAKAVTGMEADKLTMKIAVKDVDASLLPNIEVISTQGDIIILQVPRYRVFTKLVESIAAQGGTLVEIAGNDEILVSMILDRPGDFYTIPSVHTLLSRTSRVGFSSDRILLATPVTELHQVFTGYSGENIRVEHIYDY